VKPTLQVLELLLSHTTDLLGKVLDLLGITNKVASLLHNDALSVVLQLELVLGIACHVRPATVVVNLKDVAHLIHASLPLWVRAILVRIQRDGHAYSSSHVPRAWGGESL
jgi:hypothetical protein